jgi:D-sedoheptulose 7-phosphate isomerase
VQTEVFTDVALLTAVANDLGYEQVFAEPLRNRCRRGDMLVAISSSGESPNVLAAAHAAVGMLATVVTLTAMRADNRLRRMGALNFYVPAKRYGPAESCHAVMLHHWMDRVQDSWCGGRWRCGRSGQTAVSVRVEE